MQIYNKSVPKDKQQDLLNKIKKKRMYNTATKEELEEVTQMLEQKHIENIERN